jgi:hypothetical protein
VIGVWGRQKVLAGGKGGMMKPTETHFSTTMISQTSSN